MEEKKTVDEEPKASLFPLFSVVDSHPSKAFTDTISTSSSSSLPQWLCNPSFTTDLSVINDAVSSQINSQPEKEEEDDRQEQQEDDGPSGVQTLPEASRVYEQLESSGSEGDSERRKRKKKSKKKRKRQRSSERGDEFGDFGSRRSDARVWATSVTKSTKEYYFDSRGDPDNLVFGCLYKYCFKEFLL